MTTYKLLKNPDGGDPTAVIRDGKDCIPLYATDNRDYKQYLKWVAEGNEPLPADE